MGRRRQPATAMSLPSSSSRAPPGWSVCSALCILLALLPQDASAILNATTQRNGGGSQCGDYSNQVKKRKKEKRTGAKLKGSPGC